MAPVVDSRRFVVRLPNAASFALVVAVSLAFSIQILFQPGIFADFSAAVILEEVGSIFSEYLIAGTAILVAIDMVERRATPVSWVYMLEMFAGVFLGAVPGVLFWAVCTGQPISSESAPFLTGEILRLTLVGAFLAVSHGLATRAQEARARERDILLEASALQADDELAQLRLLEAQIEPHFLFNTIANLRRTWHVDRSLGMRMHDNAVRYLEASLPRMRRPTATLRDELDLTQAYLELFALRMGHRLRFSIDVSPTLDKLAFPRMSLLTLVENSIKHGLSPSASGGTVTISAMTDANAVTLRVEDDGVGLGAADTAGSGIGLANIRYRLQAEYGRAARLYIESPEAGGFVASIRVPWSKAGPA